MWDLEMQRIRGTIQSKHKPCLGAGPEAPRERLALRAWAGLGLQAEFLSSPLHLPLPAPPLLASGHPTKGPAFLPTSGPDQGPTCPVLFKHTPISSVHQEGKNTSAFDRRLECKHCCSPFYKGRCCNSEKLSDLPLVTLLITNRDDIPS